MLSSAFNKPVERVTGQGLCDAAALPLPHEGDAPARPDALRLPRGPRGLRARCVGERTATFRDTRRKVICFGNTVGRRLLNYALHLGRVPLFDSYAFTHVITQFLSAADILYVSMTMDLFFPIY